MKPVWSTGEVVERLGVSAIRCIANLNKLEAAGALVRTHGGIAAASSGMAREHAGGFVCDVCSDCARAYGLFESILRRVAILALAVLIAVWPCLRESPPLISLWPPTSFSGRMVGAQQRHLCG